MRVLGLTGSPPLSLLVAALALALAVFSLFFHFSTWPAPAAALVGVVTLVSAALPQPGPAGRRAPALAMIVAATLWTAGFSLVSRGIDVAAVSWMGSAAALAGIAVIALGPRVPLALLAAIVLDSAAVFLTVVAGGVLFFALMGGDPLGSSLAAVFAIGTPAAYCAAFAANLSAAWSVPDRRWHTPLLWLAAASGVATVGFTARFLVFSGAVADTSALAAPALILAGGLLAATSFSVREVAQRERTAPSIGIAIAHPAFPAVAAIVIACCLVGANLNAAARVGLLVDGLAALAVLVLAARAALVLHAHRTLVIQADVAVRQFTHLYDVGLATSSHTEFNEIVKLVTDHATDITACHGAILSLAEPGHGFVIRALRKFSEELRDSVGEPLIGIALEAIETRDLVIARRYREHRYSNPRLDDLIASAMAIPLIAHGNVIGTLAVYSRTPRKFSETTRRMLRLYAAQAAVAIANGRLLEESRRLASDDPLTGLLNRRLLVERLEEEVAESTRHGDAFCVVMADIDGLKEVNDSSGHLVGDEVLRRIANELRAAVRSADTVARFGGDEFVTLLPRTTALQGQALAVRASQHLREATYTWGGRDLPLPRVSVGLASFPDDGLTADTLIAKADERMYVDKGRRRAASAG